MTLVFLLSGCHALLPMGGSKDDGLVDEDRTAPGGDSGPAGMDHGSTGADGRASGPDQGGTSNDNGMNGVEGSVPGADRGSVVGDTGSMRDGDPGATIDAGVAADPLEPGWHAGKAYPWALGAMGAATLDGVIHIIGGDTDYYGTAPSRAHRVYDRDTRDYAIRADTPDNDQWGPCVIAHGGFLYSFGGWKLGGTSMRRYDPRSDTWTPMRDSNQTHVYGFACAVVDGVIYIISGASTTTGDRETDRVSAYDIASDSWSDRARFPRAEQELSGAAIGDRIYVVGRDRRLDIYDTVAGAWSTGPSISCPAGLAGVAVHRGSLYVFAPGGSNEVHRLDFPGPVWSRLPDMSSARMKPAVAVVGDEIHLFGGFVGDVLNSRAVSTHEILVVPTL